ncbi:MAG TPA: ABC transporter ATP-binding protein [Actinomycetota bacterium]|nr:ABC transporter ATP-binding protein [Actinomycetota bacterium]
MNEPDLLTFERVTAGYGARVALEDASFTVGAGEVVGLIGPNGSGKTTAVRVASRALRPSAGQVTVAGRDPYALRAREVARLVAVVPQEMSPALEFTAQEVVLIGRSPYLSPFAGGTLHDFRRVREAMESAGVAELADRPLGELSGGEKRRVILAQALAQDAPVLVLDEPTTHLDPKHVLDIMETVRRLAGAGRAVLAVFHDLNLASATCDRLIALRDGTVVANGPPDELLTSALLRLVYGVDAEIQVNPATGRPAVLYTLGDEKVKRS